MDDDHQDRDALAAAGYTSLRGAILFSLMLGTIGALVGSVIVAIVWNMLVPGTTETESTLVGTSAGALFGIVLGLIKVQRGNMEAREEVEDRAWRRHIKRELGR